jgi:hypothetical protein
MAHSSVNDSTTDNASDNTVHTLQLVWTAPPSTTNTDQTSARYGSWMCAKVKNIPTDSNTSNSGSAQGHSNVNNTDTHTQGNASSNSSNGSSSDSSGRDSKRSRK